MEIPHTALFSDPQLRQSCESARFSTTPRRDMQEFLDAISKIPESVWTGLFSTGSALGAVFLTNRHNEKQQAVQLEHDADEKARERTSGLRRDVYLVAADELTKALTFLGSLAQIDPTKTDSMAGVHGLAAATTKLLMVSDTETAGAVIRFSGHYTSVLFKAMEELMPLRGVQAQLSAVNAAHETARVEFERLTAEISRMFEAAEFSKDRHESLASSQQHNLNEMRRYANERNELHARSVQLNCAYAEYVGAEMQALQSSHDDLLVRIRADLGLQTEGARLFEHMREQRESIRESSKAFFSSLQNSSATGE